MVSGVDSQEGSGGVEGHDTQRSDVHYFALAQVQLTPVGVGWFMGLERFVGVEWFVGEGWFVGVEWFVGEGWFVGVEGFVDVVLLALSG